MDLHYILNHDGDSSPNNTTTTNSVSSTPEPSEYTFLERYPTTNSIEAEPNTSQTGTFNSHSSETSASPEVVRMHCTSYGELLQVLKRNSTQEVNLTAQFVDDQLLPSTAEDRRSHLLKALHWKYVNPVTEAMGYRWIKKEVTPKAWGKTVFTVKYRCSQQASNSGSSNERRKSESNATPGLSALPGSDSSRARKLSHPLKEYECNLNYTIRYHYSTALIDITYFHRDHLPPKRLPDCVKPFILQRLDWKAADLYEAIMEEVRFRDVRHLIHFSKVQGFWSQERGKRKEEVTKAAFRQFFNT